MHLFDQFNISNLLKNYPNTCMLITIRDPVQLCESWALIAINGKEHTSNYSKYASAIQRLIMTLLDIDNLEFSTHDSVGVRLEDIKKEPKETMRRLCAWLGIADSPTLYKSTMQGLKWWGNPGDALYGKTQTIDYGKNEPIKRNKGSLFSEKDQFILETLFYPFNARFGYVEKNQSKFINDLQTIRPLLEKPMDFEKILSNNFSQEYPPLEKTAAYKAFHAMMLGRWHVLKDYDTYPNMFRALPL